MVIRTGASNGERVVREVYARLILAKASLEGRVMSPMQRMTETCNVKLTNWKESCVTHDEDVPHPALSLPPKRHMVLVIDEDSEPRLARLFPMKRSITIDAGTKVRLTEA